MKIFNDHYFNNLISLAKLNTRRRQHKNIHQSYQDACQRLFNAIEPGSYIRPHRHAPESKNELLIAIRGAMALVTFDEQGGIANIVQFGANRVGIAAGVEIPSDTWHTVLALESGCVLFEVKAGPFDPCHPKDFASWSPEENSNAAFEYINKLSELISKF